MLTPTPLPTPTPVSGGDWAFEWRTESFGRKDRLQAVKAVAPLTRGLRVEYNYSALTEWYLNSREGVEQGFTLEQRPKGEGEIRIVSRVLKGLRARLASDAQSVELLDAAGVAALNYGKLKVVDARGKVLSSRLDVDEGHILLAFNDAEASYPVTVDPIIGAASTWTQGVGVAANDQYGYSVASAGDVNGDVYGDLIVGAWGVGGNKGAAYLYLGSASGLGAASTWTQGVGVDANDEYGFSVASAGDVNGDGYGDVIVGANGVSGNTGAAYLYLGSASGLGAASTWTQGVGVAGSDQYGYSVASAGDVNGDGYGDVMVGALGVTGFKDAAYLYLGSASGLGAASPWTQSQGVAAGDRYGTSVASAGDVNGDGYGDVVVGASGNTGAAYLYLGSASGITTPLSGEEALPPLVAWSLEVLDVEDQPLKTQRGKGPLPKAFVWDGSNDAGQKVTERLGLRLRIRVTDTQGVTTVTERPLGQELRPRDWQRSAPLFEGNADPSGGLTLRTQLGKEISGVRAWKLSVVAQDGSLMKEIKGVGQLPKSIDMATLATPNTGGLKYLLRVDSEGGSYSSEGLIAQHVRPKELLLERPSFDPSKGMLRMDVRPERKADIREWTLTIKAADGLVLKTLSGSGPLPKELAFDPSKFHIPGLDLTARRSGAAFVQLALAYLDTKGRAGVVSDVLPLAALRETRGIQDPLAGDEFQPVAGREMVAVIGPAMLSADARQEAGASRLFRVPEGVEIASWKLEMAAGSKVLYSTEGKGSLPASAYWDGLSPSGVPVDPEDLAKLRPRLILQEANGTVTRLEESEPMRRAFSAQPGGKLARRVHASWFSKGEAELQPEMVERLDLVAEMLKAHPQGRAVVQGHCSKEGDDATNEALSRQRAGVVMDYLAERGVPREQLSAQSFSNQLLLDERLDEDAVRRNRRVDVVVLE